MENNFVSNMKNAFLSHFGDVCVTVFDNTDSTNTKAKLFATSGEKKEAFFIAESQSAGRGRFGRSFVSESGGLYLSYLIYPKLSPKDSVMLTVFASVALAETIEEMTGLVPKIKWVNDVFLGDKKVAGILTEGEFSEDGNSFKYAVVGIGTNVYKRNFGAELENIATDIETECGKRINIFDFAVRLAEKLRLFEKANAKEYIQKYRARSYVIGKRVKIVSSLGEYFAKAVDIEDDGALVVRLDSGEFKTVFTGEVSLRF